MRGCINGTAVCSLPNQRTPQYLFLVDRLPGWKGKGGKLFRVAATNTSNFERVERLL